jgi:hypothetical protein
MYTLFTHQYLWNKSVPGSNTSWLWGSLKDDVYRRKPATLDDLRENIAMSCAAITLDTLQNVVHAAVRRLRQCLDADGGHFEHLHWIQNSRTSLISILLLYKYSSYDYRVIFFMSNCVYILLGHSVWEWIVTWGQNNGGKIILHLIYVKSYICISNFYLIVYFNHVCTLGNSDYIPSSICVLKNWKVYDNVWLWPNWKKYTGFNLCSVHY